MSSYYGYTLRVHIRVLPIVIFLCLLTPQSAPAEIEWLTSFEDSFDNNHYNFSGKAGWVSNYCIDSWSTWQSGGVFPRTDYGCGGNCNCYFGVFSACGTFNNGSDPYDNILHAGSLEWLNYRYEITFRNYDDDTFGAVFRYIDSTNFYMVFFSVLLLVSLL